MPELKFKGGNKLFGVMRVLVIGDRAETAAYIVEGLSTGGHVTDHVSDGRDGLMLATSGSYDALVLDRMLPGLDGLNLLKTAKRGRQDARAVPQGSRWH